MELPTTTQLLGRGMGIPPHDSEIYSYVGGGASNDDNIAAITYYRGGTTGVAVAQVTFTYWGATNNIKTMVLEVSEL